MLVNEKLRIEEYFYPSFEKNNPIFESIISNEDKIDHNQCYGQMTKWNIRSKEIRDLVKWIQNTVKENIIESYENISRRYNVVSTVNWGLICNEGDYVDEHGHFPSHFSYVYYINVPEGSSPLIFTTSGYEIYPEVGKLVVFDSKLLHKVPPNNCNGRYSFSGNLTVIA